MNTRNIFTIIVLGVLTTLTGCGGMQAQPATTASNGAILSAEDLQSMIQVTVTQLAPEEEQDTTSQEAIVAAN
ncbi:MAG: hypothetical protein ACR2QL_13100 [Woeseiaceae bacterium]